ncbi:hypothetical protein GUJ93_ZPchr0001g29738 [Zizania palustris]|uniref:AB hydrolase-1 domain-containing protein n=1 Tax=Zizania palustris TaxID=103762 RepID=A0A8J5V8R1_ZIZPA|nr:hypothetical protein GUJ93_ZPchr0001g29738 [Zizania palustris]
MRTLNSRDGGTNASGVTDLEGLEEQLWVLDSVPGQVETDNSDGEVERVLQTWVVNHMLNLGFSKALSEWIGSNLKKDNEHVTWAFDLQAAIDVFNSYRERSYWTLLEQPPKGLDIAIVQAERSDRWQPDDVQRLKALSKREGKPDAGKVSLHVLPNAGHWVHVDNPKGLLGLLGQLDNPNGPLAIGFIKAFISEFPTHAGR